MNEQSITPINKEIESISFIDSIVDNTEVANKQQKNLKEVEKEKIKLPQWDLLPEFETIDRSIDND